MKIQVLIMSTMGCGALMCAPIAALAQVSASGPQYTGTGITVNSNNQYVDRAGSPLSFGGPSNANAVFVGGTPIMRVRVGADGYTPDQRASRIQERLNKLLGQGPIIDSDITIQPMGLDAVVLVKGQLLFTADSATARFNTTTPMDLANTWANRLKSVLPGLTEPK
jgi:hypothetical protein